MRNDKKFLMPGGAHTVLVLGGSGQVGRALAADLGAAGISVEMPTSSELDLADPDALYEAVVGSAARIVFNAAAFTAVDRAESEQSLAEAVNAIAPAVLARACRESGKVLVHLSTDYVFDGTSTAPYTEADTPSPINVYGVTKLAGERAVLDSGCAAAVIRTSWVFSPHGRNFVKTMLALGREKGRVGVVADQTGCPTSARAIAGAMIELGTGLTEEPSKGGLFHLAGTPPVSWATFARDIFTRAGVKAEVIDISSEDYGTPARRPAYTVLASTRIARVWGIAAPDWRADLDHVLTQLSGSGDSRSGGL